ncbi:MAG: hypothetical protein H7A51_10860 [Akkermansiaceae bacterium]|nr:hypothetical protein [Akkermansiaceae bacterium]
MKPTKTIVATITALTFALVGCEDKKTAVPHDHDGDGKPDHGPGAHPKAVPHDHDGDGKPDHDVHPGESDDHAGHDHAKKEAGPNGGRIITTVEPHAEFFVTADHKIRITFLSADNKAVAVGAQTVDVVCGDRSNPTMLAFTKAADGNSLISSGVLPEGNNFPTIVTIKTTAEAAPVRDKFTLNLSDCPTCEYKEYACTCEHGH